MSEQWMPAVRQSLFEKLESLFRELFYTDHPANMTQDQFEIAMRQFWTLECDGRCEPNLCEFARPLDWAAYFTKWPNLCEFLQANTTDDGRISFPIITPLRTVYPPVWQGGAPGLGRGNRGVRGKK